MNKYIRVSIFITLIFFIIGYFGFQLFYERLTNYLLSLTSEAEIQAITVSDKFKNHILSTISIAILPIIGLLLFYSLQKFKGILYSWGKLTYYIFLLSGAFFVGILLKVFLLKYLFQTLDNQVIPQVVNTVQLRIVHVYDWALFSCLLMVILIFIFTKTKKRIRG